MADVIGKPAEEPVYIDLGRDGIAWTDRLAEMLNAEAARVRAAAQARVSQEFDGRAARILVSIVAETLRRNFSGEEAACGVALPDSGGEGHVLAMLDFVLRRLKAEVDGARALAEAREPVLRLLASPAFLSIEVVGEGRFEVAVDDGDLDRGAWVAIGDSIEACAIDALSMLDEVEARRRPAGPD
ncbi:MAG TPA: hypothetical protein VIL45_07150 [Thermoplasmata archaeon]